MKITDVIDDAEVMAALEVEELALRLLPWIARMRQCQLFIGEDEVRELLKGPGQKEAVRALREAWAWLEGQALLIESHRYRSPNSMRILSRKAKSIVDQKDHAGVLSARRIHKDSLHPCIREDVWSLYHRGKFDTAVFEAMKAVEVAVRDASNLDGEIGVPLMRKAFDKNSGPLADMSMDEGEREMRAHFFAGATGSYKNPQSHRKVALDDPDEAAEIIMVANHLLRIVDARRSDEKRGGS